MQLVDGLQRLTAVRRFMAGELAVFGGHRLADIEDPRYLRRVNLRFYVNALRTRADVLRWYLELNAGQVAHAPEELARVAGLLRAEAA